MIVRLTTAISLVLLTGCGVMSTTARPDVAPSSFELVSAGRLPTEAIESAQAAVGLATATGSLNAMSGEITTRSLARETSGVTQGVGGPDIQERHVVLVEAAPTLPPRTMVTVQAVAGPPVEQAARRRSNTDRFAVPIENPRITSRFGPRIDPITGARGRMHRGTDYGAPTGTNVLATASGTVVLGGWCDGGTGNCVVIDHAGEWRSQYFHLSRVHVSPGDVVTQGEVIGEVGSTGRSTGPHLHFQLGVRGGDAVDPEPLMGQPVE